MIDDQVNSPKHYMGPFECIELSSKYSFCAGNAIKYVWRHLQKGKPVQDLEKAKWYIDRLTANQEALHTVVVSSDFDQSNDVDRLLDILIDYKDENMDGWANAKAFWFAVKCHDKIAASNALEDMIDEAKRK